MILLLLVQASGVVVPVSKLFTKGHGLLGVLENFSIVWLDDAFILNVRLRQSLVINMKIVIFFLNLGNEFLQNSKQNVYLPKWYHKASSSLHVVQTSRILCTKASLILGGMPVETCLEMKLTRCLLDLHGFRLGSSFANLWVSTSMMGEIPALTH